MKRKKVKMKTLISFITKKFIKSIKLEKIKEKKISFKRRIFKFQKE